MSNAQPSTGVPSERRYVESFLKSLAAPELVYSFVKAMKRASAAGTQMYLAHVASCILDDAAVQARIPKDVRSRAQASLAEQLLAAPQAASQAGEFAFALALLVEPAQKLAGDLGADRVAPLTFLATCLSAAVPLDSESSATQERLRSAGLTVETLVPSAAAGDVRRHDFTFTSLGFGSDITAMARAGYWPSCPLVGMGRETLTLAKLLNSGTGSAVIVGEPGVGKSAFIQGFAYFIATQDRRFIPPTMDSWTVVMIESVDILQGMAARGELEGRIRTMLDFFRKNPTVVPFFDEIHRLLDTEDPTARTVATAMKPPMANGVFRCVGCTTDKEYARFIANDEAMNSRFRKVLLAEPDHPTAFAIIEGSQSNLLRGRAAQTGVSIGADAIDAAVKITATYQRSDRLPRKAINLLSHAVSEKVFETDMAEDRSAVSLAISAADVARLFSDISGIPVDALDPDRAGYYDALPDKLESRVRGQRHAIDAVASWLSLQSRGWVDQRRPRGRFVFLGPPGVGKTELATSIAEEVLRDRGSMIVLNMADYQGDGARNKFMGADPGYVGFGQTSTIYSRVMMRPFSVVVLDEFEKSDPSIANPLLSILDGWAEDSQGRAVDFSQCVLILTSNAVMSALSGSFAEPLAEAFQRADAATDPADRDRLHDAIDGLLRQTLAEQGGIWTQPLLDRIDRLCLFRPLSDDTLREILNGLIAERRRLATKPLPLAIDGEEVRAGILAEATRGSAGASARRLERAMLRWLASSARHAAAPGASDD